jgi:Leucine-rich repeat (LRR) protein
LSKLKNLRVLDLGNNSIDLPINEFYNFILLHIKKLPKLEFLSFSGNPVVDKINEFRYFLVNELPKLKYIDWEPSIV